MVGGALATEEFAGPEDDDGDNTAQATWARLGHPRRSIRTHRWSRRKELENGSTYRSWERRGWIQPNLLKLEIRQLLWKQFKIKLGEGFTR